jgi:hypothetical protein
MTTEDLLNYYYKKDTILLDGRKASKVFRAGALVGIKGDRRHSASASRTTSSSRKGASHQGR